MLRPLVELAGTAVPMLGLWGAWALGLPRGAAVAAAGAVAAGFAALLVWPIEDALHGVLGLLTAGVVLAAAARLLLRRSASGFRCRRGPGARASWLLVLWLVLEVTGYFATAPFPAVRRVLGVVLASTMLIARLASRAQRVRRGRRGSVVPVIVGVGVLIGVGVALADLREARAQRFAAQAAARRIREREPAAPIWFVGHWGFQHYAEQAGMHPVIPDLSRLASGDWLVVPSRVHRQEIELDLRRLARVERLDVGAPARVVTGHDFYAGSRVLSHFEGPLQSVDLYRVDHGVVVPRTPGAARRLAAWIERAGAGSKTAAAAAPALARHALGDDLLERNTAEVALEALGSGAAAAVDLLREALSDPDPAVRARAAAGLGRIGPPARVARTEIETLLTDVDRQVREAAARALARVGPP
jgi:hypothetical protein